MVNEAGPCLAPTVNESAPLEPPVRAGRPLPARLAGSPTSPAPLPQDDARLPVLQNGTSIVSGWSDGRIRAFGPQSGKLLFTINDAHHGAVTAIAGTADSARILSGGEEGAVRVWRVSKESRQMEASMKVGLPGSGLQRSGGGSPGVPSRGLRGKGGAPDGGRRDSGLLACLGEAGASWQRQGLALWRGWFGDGGCQVGGWRAGAAGLAARPGWAAGSEW